MICSASARYCDVNTIIYHTHHSKFLSLPFGSYRYGGPCHMIWYIWGMTYHIRISYEAYYHTYGCMISYHSFIIPVHILVLPYGGRHIHILQYQNINHIIDYLLRDCALCWREGWRYNVFIYVPPCVRVIVVILLASAVCCFTRVWGQTSTHHCYNSTILSRILLSLEQEPRV